MAGPSLILTGFMGTGKSSAGAQAARLLDLPFLDTDAALRLRLGSSLRRVFRERGEPYFRAQEAELLQELALTGPRVLSTGGGTLLPESNRALLLEHGAVMVLLTCSTEELLRRLRDAEDLPLLDVPDRPSRIDELLTERAEAYRAIPHRIDTTGRPVEEVALEAARIYRRSRPG